MDNFSNKSNNIRNFLLIGKAEGYSYLLLLFVAMPIKYVLHQPIYVRIVGSIHGLLFVSFMITILILLFKRQFELKNSAQAFVLSLLPFGTFFLHKIVENNNITID
jgi:integral membrane protein